MTGSAAMMVETKRLTKRFGEVTAVDGVTLEVRRGEIFGVVGPDGAGKTTLLRLLCGLLDPSAGEAWVAGYDASRETKEVKDRIGYLAQRFGLYSDLTVEENMRFYADVFGMSEGEREALVPILLRMTRMEPFRERQAGRLSGGMKQKLALMCTLLHRPQILFLDEPTNGVDPVSRRDFWEILRQLAREGMTALLTTSYLDEAERCDRVGLVHRGRLIRCGAPAAIKSEIEEDCYEVRCPDRHAAKSFFQAQPGVRSVEPAGATLHLFLAPSMNSPGVLASALNARGLGPAELRPIQPSLEDVFILLIGKQTEALHES